MTAAFSHGTATNNHDDDDLVVVCAVPTSFEDTNDNFNHQDVTSVAIPVFDANDDVSGGSVRAQACVTFFDDATGGSCGAEATTSAAGTGYSTLAPSTSSWTSGSTDPEDYPSLVITLPDFDAAAGSFVIGFTVESP